MLFLVVGAIVVVVVVQSIRVSRVNRIYERLARRYRGEIQRGGLFHMPHLRFVYKGAHVLIDTLYSSFPKRVRNQTQFHISWPDQQLQLQVCPSRFIGRLRQMLGNGAIRIGGQFDRRYHIMGNNPDAVTHFLSGGVQHVIDQLRQTFHSRDLRVHVSQGILVIRKPGSIREFVELERLARLGLELFDQAMLTRLAGIEIVAESSVVVSGEAQCKICGETIQSDIVYCLKCRTPHHFECWQYYGACSTYGCGETKYTRY